MNLEGWSCSSVFRFQFQIRSFPRGFVYSALQNSAHQTLHVASLCQTPVGEDITSALELQL